MQYIVRSTDVDRTLMSAESQMAALFYPTPEQQFNQTITWQPIPVHTVPTTDDFVSVYYCYAIMNYWLVTIIINNNNYYFLLAA